MSAARNLADKAADVLAFFLRLGGRMFYHISSRPSGRVIPASSLRKAS
jgi:hypothetical protein